MNAEAFVRKYDRPNARVRLFCFTYAASSAQIFHRWNDHAPEWIEISGCELPGHGARLAEKPIGTQDAAAVEIADTLDPLLDRPYALFGHCLGAALAYEATRILRSRGKAQPVRLFSSGARGPHLGIPIADVESMEDDEFIEHMHKAYSAPIEFLRHPEMRPLFLPMVRADARLTQNYRYQPGPPVSYPITAVAGETDPDVQMEHLEGWRRHTDASVATRIYPGNHFFFLESAPRLLADFVSELESSGV
ncbi:MAG TPA: alpha/beta fold hydrolase [Thermoanaerobaculia bacterium]|nr:alpha/beta fold hydrolase [Thermoanaerobaculia bacterium]